MDVLSLFEIFKFIYWILGEGGERSGEELRNVCENTHRKIVINGKIQAHTSEKL